MTWKLNLENGSKELSLAPISLAPDGEKLDISD